ncbi:hypothetical protein BSZ19_18345 [Bradyrhizobium japonicum]|uniref:Uncharacterized protein n=1 Tax=Bradyrhizobium japonicum TaxID=375 RepID=A0A1Y2JQ04_BRAJP|nr:hypothetical protein BSZ19_18345 [Bradyrhizobium japonicum]
MLPSPEFHETQLASATTTPRADNCSDNIFFDAMDSRQPVERLGYFERFSGAQQTVNLADGSPRIVEYFEDRFIQRSEGASRHRRHSKTRCSCRELPPGNREAPHLGRAQDSIQCGQVIHFAPLRGTYPTFTLTAVAMMM